MKTFEMRKFLIWQHFSTGFKYFQNKFSTLIVKLATTKWCILCTVWFSLVGYLPHWDLNQNDLYRLQPVFKYS